MIFTLTLNPAVDLEITAEDLQFDEVNRATSSRRDCGGKGLNVSRMLKKLDVPSIAMGFAGGKTGAWLEEKMHDGGISTDFTSVAGDTRTNISLVTDNHGRHIKVNEPGPEISAIEFETLIDSVQKQAAEGDWWVLAGSLPKGVSADCYACLIDIIHSAGGHTLLDTSGEAFTLGCKAGPTLVKPNLEEALQLLGEEKGSSLSPEQCAQRILELGPKNVVISLGKDGVVFASDDEVKRVGTPTIVEKNPTGAGDSLVAGLVSSLSAGHSLADAVRFGSACGAATASLPGTELGSKVLVQSLLNSLLHSLL